MTDLVDIVERYKEEQRQLEESTLEGALSFFLDYHKKHGGDPQRNLVKVARITNVDYRKLEQDLHDRIRTNRPIGTRRAPKELAFRKDLLK
jgi:hypothetical protein